MLSVGTAVMRWAAERFPQVIHAPRVRNSVETVSTGALYEGGSHTRRTQGWRAPTVGPNTAVLANLATLRDRSRAACRNDGYAKSIIDKLVTNIIGTGIQPLSQAKDPELRKQIDALWLRWTDESDADGMLDWYGQQTQAVRCWLEAGDAFARLRMRLESDGLSVPIQVQILEPELCPHTHTVFGQNIRAGIEFNGIGRRTAYYFHPSRPEQDDFDQSILKRVPADSVCHLYDPLRPGQLRGLPHLTQALVTLYELDKYDDATLLRQQLANMYMMFVKRAATVGDTETVNPMTGEVLPTADDGQPFAPMEPGITQELAPGEAVEFSNPPATQGYEGFMRQHLMGAAAASGVPYEVFTNDMRGVNDRTVRLILNDFRRRIQAYQHQVVVYQLCRKVWNAWFDRVFLSGALPIPLEYLNDPTPWSAVVWQPQGWPYMHPVQDVQAAIASMRAGLSSRSGEVSARGDSSEAIDLQQKADNERADEHGLRYDSDGRNSKAGAPVEPAAPEPEPEEIAA